MQKAAVALAFGLGLASCSIDCRADIVDLAKDDTHYVGRIQDGIPSDLTAEMFYVNTLIGLAANQIEQITTPSPPCGHGSNCTETYYRSALQRPFPEATEGLKYDSSSNTAINVQGYTYILGKYAASNAGVYVWYVAGLTSVDLPAKLGGPNNNKYGLSHYAVFHGVPVPDGGATVMPLGGALVGLEILRRRFTA